MKRIICLLLVLISLFSLASCGENDGYKTYKEGHVSFRIPESLEKRTVQYADVYYTNGEMYIMIQAFSNQRIVEELDLYEKITVTDYVNLFMNWNGYNSVYVYDEANEKVQFDEVSSFQYEDVSSVDYEYFIFYRREGGIYAICLGCDAELKPTYEEIFKYIDSTVKID